MPQTTNPNPIPKDIYGYPGGVYVPNVGLVAQQGGVVATDTGGQPYAPGIAQLSGPASLLNIGQVPLPLQKNNSVSSGAVAAQTCAFKSNVTAGNSIVVVCGVGNGTAATVTDSLGNTYNTAINGPNSTTFAAQIFYAVNILGGANTVTVTPSASVSVAVQIYELPGLIQQVGNALDETSIATGTGTATAAANIASVSPNAYAFMGVAVGTAVQASSVTAGTFWTLDSTQNVGGSPSGLFSFGAFSQPMGMLPVTPKSTIAGSEPWALAAAVFKPVLLAIGGTVQIGGYNYTRVTTAATTLAKTGPGVLHAVTVATPTSTGTLELDDAITNTTPIISKFLFPAGGTPFSVTYDVEFLTGLSITVAVATIDATISWK